MLQAQHQTSPDKRPTVHWTISIPWKCDHLSVLFFLYSAIAAFFVVFDSIIVFITIVNFWHDSYNWLAKWGTIYFFGSMKLTHEIPPLMGETSMSGSISLRSGSLWSLLSADHLCWKCDHLCVDAGVMLLISGGPPKWNLYWGGGGYRALR